MTRPQNPPDKFSNPTILEFHENGLSRNEANRMQACKSLDAGRLWGRHAFLFAVPTLDNCQLAFGHYPAPAIRLAAQTADGRIGRPGIVNRQFDTRFDFRKGKHPQPQFLGFLIFPGHQLTVRFTAMVQIAEWSGGFQASLIADRYAVFRAILSILDQLASNQPDLLLGSETNLGEKSLAKRGFLDDNSSLFRNWS